MRKHIILLVALICLGAPALAQSGQAVLDSNVAFFEGDELNYIIYAPRDFEMDESEAVDNGYSFAFRPEGSTLDHAEMFIGVNLFKIRGMSFEDLIKRDTSAIREHYGDDSEIEWVDPVKISSGQYLKTLYIDNKAEFLPNVMMSYFDGETEVLIFELVISADYPRFLAEETYVSCLQRVKAMPHGELEL